ncbi:MAG: EamA family transporter [Bacillota bacterium]|nr:EamA family transporter [Bacillota bacterium]
MPYNKNLTILSYLTVCIVWGSTYLAIRIGVTDMPFLAFAGIRFFTAGVIILTISLIKRWTFPETFQDYKTLIIAGALLLFVSNGLICWAEQWLESNLTALLVASVPLFMALIETIFPKDQRIGGLGWVGLVVGFIGVAFLVSPHVTMGGRTFPAMLAVLGASMNWAMASIYLKRRTVSGSMMPNVGIQMTSAGLAFLLSAFFFGGISIAGASSRGIAALIYLIIIGSIIAYTAFNYMIKALPASKAGTYAYINPVVAVILGALILQEEITLRSIIAAAVILGGVILVQISKVKYIAPAAVEQASKG